LISACSQLNHPDRAAIIWQGTAVSCVGDRPRPKTLSEPFRALRSWPNGCLPHETSELKTRQVIRPLPDARWKSPIYLSATDSDRKACYHPEDNATYPRSSPNLPEFCWFEPFSPPSAISSQRGIDLPTPRVGEIYHHLIFFIPSVLSSTVLVIPPFQISPDPPVLRTWHPHVKLRAAFLPFDFHVPCAAAPIIKCHSATLFPGRIPPPTFAVIQIMLP